MDFLCQTDVNFILFHSEILSLLLLPFTSPVSGWVDQQLEEKKKEKGEGEIDYDDFTSFSH